MKTLIIYASHHGCAEIIAEKMKEDLGKDVVLVNLKKEPVPSVDKFQRIIVGGSIRAGQVQKRLRTFCTQNLDELRNKEIGLYICYTNKGENAKKQLMNAYPEELYNAAKSTAVFKSGFDYRRMNFLEKMIARNVRRLKPNTYKMDYEAVHKFSRCMDRVFNPFLFIA